MREILQQGAAALGVSLADRALSDFEIYYRLLTERNRVMNLTAITGEAETARLHFLDSLALLPMATFAGASVIDVGSGAGLPGLPLRIAEPTVRLTLLDAQQKRVDFLMETAEALQIPCLCLHGRAEEQALLPSMRDSYDLAVSRAVARLNLLCELCLPFVRVGGAFLAMKGTDADEELQEAAHALEVLGGVPERVHEYTVPGTDVRHRVVRIRKIAPTPGGYPRKFARIRKSPL